MLERQYVTRLNKFANQNLIQKALTSASGVGEGLIPENLEKVITDTVIRLTPELGMMEPKDTQGAKVHEFNRLTAKPQIGGAMGENATTPVTNSKTVRSTVDLKIVRRKSKITDFLSDTARKYIDAAAYEMQNHLEAHIRDLIHYIMYGNAPSNTYEFSGLDFFISTNRDNQSRGGIVPTSLEVLDDMVDASNRKGAAAHRRVFEMSPEMLSVISRLETTVRKTKDLNGNPFGIIEVPGGWRLATYRDIPIVETTSTSPIETMRPGITLDQDTTGGSLSDDTYYVQVAPVTPEGEQLASAEQSIVVNGGGSTQIITIELDDIHKDASGEVSAYKYKVYLSTATQEETLNLIVPSLTYGTDGNPVAVTTAYNGDASNKITIISTTPTTDVPSHMRSDVPLVSTGGIAPEILALWDMDPIQGLGKLPFTNTGGSMFNGLVTTEPLAKTDDFLQFLVKTYTALADPFEATSVWRRGWRVA